MCVCVCVCEDDLWIWHIRHVLHTIKNRVYSQLDERRCLIVFVKYGTGNFEIIWNDRCGMTVWLARCCTARRSAAAVAANISSSCCTAGDRAHTKGRVTKTTYIFSTQFQTLKGKRDLLAGPASIIPSTNTMLDSLRVLVVRRRSASGLREDALRLGSMCY